MACCIFKGCFNKPVPFGKVVFFNLPKDEPRRGRWLRASGNEEVQNLPASARRLVCEAHFEERYLRRQFHRTTLNRDAVPVDYGLREGDSLVYQSDEVKEEVLIKEKRDTTNEEDALVTDQEEVLLISADEESDYEVMAEEILCEESEPNEYLEIPLVDGEETGEEQLMTEGDDLAQESDEVIEAFMIEEIESCEEETKNADHKPQDNADDTNTMGSTLDITARESLKHQDNTDEPAQESSDAVEALVIEDFNVSKRKHKNVVNIAKNKLSINVASSKPAKRFKNEEVFEPDTSSVSVTPVAAETQKEVSNLQAIEQPSTSSCISSVTAAPAPGKMSEEEYFALSLVGPLQRLPPEKRAIAKMKILTYLVQLECGLTDANL